MAHNTFTVLAALALVSLSASAQLPRQHIHQRTAVSPEGFSQATDVQELVDGRIIVVDVREGSLLIVDFVGGSSRPLGRRGSGPNEYESVGPLRSYAGDSIVMLNFGARRFTIGGTVRGERMPTGVTRVTGGPQYIDAQGRPYHDITYLDLTTMQMAPESFIVRFDPATGDSRVIAPFRSWYPEHSTRWRAPLMTQDIWAAASDGRVVRVTPDPYRVEWYRDDSLVVTGPPVPHERVQVTAEDREAYHAARGAQPAARVALSGSSARGGREAGRPSSPAASGNNDADFPRVKPPFTESYVGSTARISPEGDVWVVRAAASGDSVATIDVFNDRGMRTRQVTLPAHRTLLGFGRENVYLIRTDDDGLQWIERHRR